ncbi:hypothetical protein [Methylocapsa sp. S129]|uniref:hypothetical protein n=1 Tax=Methylocapsa sp. S129 TaxID=1641869 RepID=UPI00131B8514|nr:hypothetical protein [Methylocapsa sp. S129]
MIEFDRDYRPSADIRYAPTTRACQELHANPKIGMFHFTSQNVAQPWNARYASPCEPDPNNTTDPVLFDFHVAHHRIIPPFVSAQLGGEAGVRNDVWIARRPPPR